MAYGFNSNLKSNAVHTVLDYTRGFLNEVKSVRSSEEVGVICLSKIKDANPTQERQRPLVLIGHSFGGILVAQASSPFIFNLP